MSDPQIDYVKTWQAEHPDLVYGEPWACALCNQVVQTAGNDVAYQGHNVKIHQDCHGRDWTAYQEAAGQGAERGRVEG